MSITDELREYVRHYSVAGSMKDKTLTAIADRIDAAHQKALDEWKVEHGQMWLKGYSECHAELLEGNETLASDLERCGWIRLPKDADGEPFHIGELVDEMLPFGGYAAPAPIDTMELSRGASGYVWMVKLDAENRALISPKLLRHHAPTVEDVLREFAEKMNENLGMYTGEAIDADEWRSADAKTIAEYAAKLKLAEEDA